MALTRCEAVVIRTYPLGDTSRIAVLYSREFGLVRGVAKGARGPKSRFGAGLEPLSIVDVVLYRKDGRELDLLSKVDVIQDWRAADLARVSHGQAALELVDRLVAEAEPEPRLYDLLRITVTALATAPLDRLISITLAFQLHAATLLGYAPTLDRCAVCGAPPAGRFAPAMGGVVCARCADAEGIVVQASNEAMSQLAVLAAWPAAGIAEAPGPLVRAAEMLRLVELFLIAHAQRFQGFRSLALLSSIDGVAA